jgi:diguanylate cyclase (GGDEF)-like protein
MTRGLNLTPFQRLKRIGRTLLQAVVGFALVLLSVIWLGVWHQIQTERQAVGRDIAQEAANLAVVFEQNISRTASEIERVLKYLRQAYERNGFAANWAALLQEGHIINDQTVQIAVIDAKGMMITSTAMLYPQRPVDLSDREHFRVHAHSSLDQLYVSKPVIGRASGKWSIQFTRRYSAADGSFGGVIVVSLDPSHLSYAYGGLNLGKGGGLALVGTDDIVRAGTGIYANAVGTGLRESVEHGDRETTENGTELLIAEVEGQVRRLAFRRVKGLSLSVVVAGRSVRGDSTLIRNQRNYIAGASLLSLLILVATFAALRSRHRHEAELVRLARHDPLTGLRNRAQLSEDLRQAFEEAGEQQNFALHLIDLDGFKYVNDTRGHPFGDKLLRAVAARLCSLVPHKDLVARVGGDEFAIVQTGVASMKPSNDLAEQVCRILAEPYAIDGVTATIGVSIGISWGGKDAKSPSDLMKAADLALYAAKSDGRGCHRFHSPEMFAVHEARRALGLSLRAAIVEDQLELHYQPILDLKTRKIVGYEALTRWRHPTLGQIPPADFIPVAEETRLIMPLGTWVLNTACRDMAKRPSHLRVSVNVSPIQFRSADLVNTIRSALAASGLAPERLEIEITESTLMQRDSTTISQIMELHALGVRIVMDDFGTGYSSLSYLHTYPISAIKIDRSFVKSLGDKKSAAAIIRAIITLASALGMTTVAEGVETSEQYEQLTSLGCTEVQGYYISPPKAESEILPPAVAGPADETLAA